MKELHDKQKKLIRLLLDNIGDPLTMKELAEQLEVASTSVVHHHITQLEKKGLLTRDPNNPSNYQIKSEEQEKQVAYLNLYGMAQCGPNGSILSGNPEDRIPVSTSLLNFPSRDAFLVRARGDSMVPRINPGDLVIARKTFEPINGQIVVCVNDGVALIKKIQILASNAILLHSFNPEVGTLEAKDFRVEGVVKGIAFRAIQ